MNIIVGYDCIHLNVHNIPAGAQAAGYTTGSADIVWTAADWASHPGAVRICQDFGATDTTADVLDVESGAATNGQTAGWVKSATSSFNSARRAGQRTPAVYTSASNVTPLVNTLFADGVKGGVGLWVANWNLSESQAIEDIQAAAGPFPIVAVQYGSGTWGDFDVFSGTWLRRTSGATSYSHKTNGTDSIGTLASSRGMKATSWINLQERLNPSDAENLVSAAVPPANLRWWTVHP
jgi:hypothetical protein